MDNSRTPKNIYKMGMISSIDPAFTSSANKYAAVPAEVKLYFAFEKCLEAVFTFRLILFVEVVLLLFATD